MGMASDTPFSHKNWIIERSLVKAESGSAMINSKAATLELT
jgi:hypothetical protein